MYKPFSDIHAVPLEYTGCLILNNALKFLEKYDKYGKMFQTKAVWFRGGHKTIPLI